jgi:DNA excision repair protein ERCC-2
MITLATAPKYFLPRFSNDTSSSGEATLAMRFFIDELLVLFPYDFIYPEQLEYMRSFKEGLDRRGHLVLEMPSGTGKTISILSLVVAYWAAHSARAAPATANSGVKRDGDDAASGVKGEAADGAQERIRIVYCTRTVAEMVKTAGELKRLVAYWDAHEPGRLAGFTGVCLSARKNLCANADVARFTYGQEVDAACRSVTSDWSKTKCPLFASIDVEDLAQMATRANPGARSSIAGARAAARSDGQVRPHGAAAAAMPAASARARALGTSTASAAAAAAGKAKRQRTAGGVLLDSDSDGAGHGDAAAAAAADNEGAGAAQATERSAHGEAALLDAIVAGGGGADDAGTGTRAERRRLTVPAGVYDVDALMALGLQRGVCPYLLSRHAVMFEADLVISSFLYMVDPKVSPAVTRHMPRQTIVVLDEGHNVDDVCIEALSMVVSRADTGQARDGNMKELEGAVNRMTAENRQRLADEFQRIATGRDLVRAGAAPGGGGGGGARAGAGAELVGAHPAALLDQAMLDKAVPQQIRQLSHFVPLLGRVVDFFHRFLCRMTYAQVADPLTFLSKVRDECQVDMNAMRFLSGRLSALLQTLQVEDTYRFRHVQLIADFVTTLATHLVASGNAAAAAGGGGSGGSGGGAPAAPGAAAGSSGSGGPLAAGAAIAAAAAQFAVICEPHDPQRPAVPDPVLQLACLDPSLAMRDVVGRFDSVVLTSGTLSPLHLAPKMLGFTPVVSRSLPMTLSRRCVAPLIVTRSADQTSLEDVALTSSFKVRKDADVNRHVLQAYASLLLNLAQVTPDGICVFFTGYQYMNEVLTEWNTNGFLRQLSEHKLIFIETQGVEETAKCLANFRRACDIGRGAVFFSIARGKIAEGIDFDGHYGRAVVMFGVPFLPPTDRALIERLKWMQANLGISDTEYRSYDAMRQASQCIGRVIRNKTDYGLMVLVDQRFSRPELRRKLPEWIAANLGSNGGLSTESAVAVARRFFREMAQPWDTATELGSTLFDVASLAQRGFDRPQATPRSVRSAAPGGAQPAPTTTTTTTGQPHGDGSRGAGEPQEDAVVELDASFRAERAPAPEAQRGRAPVRRARE